MRYASKVDANQTALVRKLRRSGWLVKTELARLGKGWPDALAVKDGRHVWIEFKNPDASKGQRVPNPDQVKWHTEFRAYRAEVVVVLTAADLEQFERPAHPPYDVGTAASMAGARR